jgi:hypothetical protein
MLITKSREPIGCGVELWGDDRARRATRHTPRHQIATTRLRSGTRRTLCQTTDLRRRILFKDTAAKAAQLVTN